MTVAMIQTSGLPKAPCYFLGRDPLDEPIGRVFRCAQEGDNTIRQTEIATKETAPARGRARAVIVGVTYAEGVGICRC
jgi:hypothetical protein